MSSAAEAGAILSGSDVPDHDAGGAPAAGRCSRRAVPRARAPSRREAMIQTIAALLCIAVAFLLSWMVLHIFDRDWVKPVASGSC